MVIPSRQPDSFKYRYWNIILTIHLILIFLCIPTFTYAQIQTLILQPGPADGKDAEVQDISATTNHGNVDDFIANAWTAQGVPLIDRSLIEFDLTSILSNSTVISATLTLHTNLNSSNYQLNAGSNASWLIRVVDAWQEDLVTWANQPAIATSNFIYLPPLTANDTVQYNVNVTSDVQNMVSNPSGNHGWMIKLQSEVLYRCMVFASSDNAVAVWRPKLTIIYSCPAPATAGIISGPQNVCPGDTGKVYTVAPVPGATGYIWSLPPGASITSGANTNTIKVSYSMNAASGNMLVSALNSCGNSPNSPPLPITVYTIQVPTISGPDTLCVPAAGMTYSTEPGMINYIWSVSPEGTIISGQGTDSVTVNWSYQGNLTVSVNYADSAGCEAPDPTVLNVKADSVPGMPGPIDGPSGVCVNAQQISYSVVAVPDAQSYQWSVPTGVNIVSGSGTNSIVVNFSHFAVSGMFMVSASNECGSGPPSDSLYVSINQPPSAYAGPDTSLCQEEPYTVSGATASNYSAFHWEASGMGVFVNGNTLQPTYYTWGPNTGSQWIELVAAGLPGCPNATSYASLYYYVPPVLEFGDDLTSCDTTPVMLIYTVTSFYDSLAWYISGHGHVGKNAGYTYYYPDTSDVTAGSVKIALTAFIGNICPPASDTLIITFIEQACAGAGPDTLICENGQLHLDKAFAKNYSSLSWSTSGSGTFSDPNALNPVYYPGEEDVVKGYARLKLTAAPREPCQPVYDSLLLTLGKLPLVHAGSDTSLCNKGSVRISNASVANFHYFKWSTNGQGILTDTNTFTPVYTAAAGESGIITLTLKSFGNPPCEADSVMDHVSILVYDRLYVEAGPDQRIQYNSSATLSCSVTTGSENYSYDWKPASLFVDHSIASPITVNLTVDTTLYIYVTDRITGCSGKDSIRIMVEKEITENCLVFHNVITPNGDGLNDSWIIDCIGEFPENKVEIFNRWGDRVSSFENYDNTSVVWKGTDLKGLLLPEGTYYYILKIKNRGSYAGWVYIRYGLK